MNPEILADLRNILAVLYIDELSIRRVVADAGLSATRIKFGAAVIDVWHLVLTEAVNVDRMEGVLTIAERDYGENTQLQRACARYRQAVLQSVAVRVAPVEAMANPPIKPEPQPVRDAIRPYPPIINHDGAIQQFRQLLAPNPQLRFMRLLGDGEMGKTTLMSKIFPIIAGQHGIRYAYIDMRNQAQEPIDFLHAICGQIDRRGFRAFDRAHEQWLTRPKIQVAGFQAILSRIQVSAGREDDQHREDLTLHLTRKFVDDLYDAPHRRVLLLFDTVNDASAATQTWLIDKLLVQLHALPHVCVVVSGRTLPDPSGVYAPHCCSHELRPVDDLAAYVRYCRELNVPLSEAEIHLGAQFCLFNPGRFAHALKLNFPQASVSHG